MDDKKIQLLQFLVCKGFSAQSNDCYTGESVLSNIYVPKFPFYFDNLFAVTCWRKDERFHKEVIQYVTGYGTSTKSPHMDIEPLRDSVLFRWHKHRFPTNFAIEEPTQLTVQVVLDWEVKFETYILIEKRR
ncbi:MAG: hypothetical protein Q8R76_03625 [Candidatus Omnitrophota bacterium]|nr:hypothetical protein [Candidatus Omnitrophota bacterium]